MDQDFHHYGTFYAARTAGFDTATAGRIGKAANFIDFLHEGDYGGPWRLVSETSPVDDDDYNEVAVLEHPRLTFQSNKLSVGVWPEDGLWCSFHFTPGNYDHVEGPSANEVHGDVVAALLPGHQMREIAVDVEPAVGRMLNRPQSVLSTSLIADAVACATDQTRPHAILGQAVGGDAILASECDAVERFRQVLIGVRAHVIADTWAHQDWSGIDNDINTYWDIGLGIGRQAIEYQDVDDTWHQKVLSSFSHENLQAVPNATSYLGHGWMGHFPDYSFAKYRYRPRWAGDTAEPLVRDNPVQYRHAFLELSSLLAQCQGDLFDPGAHVQELTAAGRAIDEPCVIADHDVCPRAESAKAWLHELGPLLGTPAPGDVFDAALEPDTNARLDGLLHHPGLISELFGGAQTVSVTSDLYLFQIAVDYHFNYVKRFLSDHGIYEYAGHKSQLPGPLGHNPD